MKGLSNVLLNILLLLLLIFIPVLVLAGEVSVCMNGGTRYPRTGRCTSGELLLCIVKSMCGGFCCVAFEGV